MLFEVCVFVIGSANRSAVAPQETVPTGNSQHQVVLAKDPSYSKTQPGPLTQTTPSAQRQQTESKLANNQQTRASDQGAQIMSVTPNDPSPLHEIEQTLHRVTGLLCLEGNNGAVRPSRAEWCPGPAGVAGPKTGNGGPQTSRP